MLSPRLTNCPECSNIPDLLKKINCKLAELGNSLYNNISYMLNQPIPAGEMLQLIAYRRILTHKYCNPNYVHEYSVAMIASRVIRITAGCVSKCNEPERCLEDPCDIDVVANPTTTSTTTEMIGCKSFILYNTATITESFLIGNCDTGEPETITLQGLSSTCINTSVTLNVSPNIVVIDTDECTTTTTTTAVPTTTTTSSTSTSTSTTTSTTTLTPTTTTTSSSTSTTTSSTSTSTSTTTTTVAPTTTTTTTSCPDCISGNSIPIGTQKWTNCNLDVTTYRNGDIIPQVTDPTAWENLTTGAWCYFNNDPANGETYGKLYNWYAVNDPRGLAPVGYHVPTDAEWTVLTDYLDAQLPTGNVGGKMKEAGLCHWGDPNTDATNDSGFTGLPGGYRNSDGTFDYIGIGGYWWSASEFDTANAWNRILIYNNGTAYRSYANKPIGFSVRLIEDAEPITTTTTTTTTPLDCTFTGSADEIIPIFGIGDILGTSGISSPFFRIYNNTLLEISQLPSVGVTANYGINASDNYQYSIAAAGGGAPLQVKVSNNYGNSYSTPIGVGSGYTRETLISKNGEYMYIESGSTLLRSDNSGTSFSSVSLPVTFTIFIQSSISWDGQYVIVAGNNSTVFSILLSTDYGITFTNITLNIFPSQSAANSSIGQCAAVSGNGQYMMVMAGTGTNNSYRSTDFGVTWTIMSIVSQDFNEDLKLSYDGRYGIVGAANNRVIITNDFGVTWTTNTFSSNIYKTGISNSGQYMLAELSGIFQTQISSNYGATWTSYSSGTKKYLSFIN